MNTYELKMQPDVGSAISTFDPGASPFRKRMKAINASHARHVATKYFPGCKVLGIKLKRRAV